MKGENIRRFLYYLLFYFENKKYNISYKNIYMKKYTPILKDISPEMLVPQKS